MNVELNDVYQLAKAARLAITEHEAHAVFDKIQGISKMIEEMRLLDTTGIQPMTHVALHAQPLRQDTPLPVEKREHWQASAPSTHEGFYLVPQVID
jgi:aspartyl-tRNA(Asn)/glutamyl-tRNA(Gln) amidotransferase subunit C